MKFCDNLEVDWNKLNAHEPGCCATMEEWMEKNTGTGSGAGIGEMTAWIRKRMFPRPPAPSRKKRYPAYKRLIAKFHALTQDLPRVDWKAV